MFCILNLPFCKKTLPCGENGVFQFNSFCDFASAHSVVSKKTRRSEISPSKYERQMSVLVEQITKKVIIFVNNKEFGGGGSVKFRKNVKAENSKILTKHRMFRMHRQVF